MRKTGASLIAASVLAGAFWSAGPVQAQTPYDVMSGAAAAAGVPYPAPYPPAPAPYPYAAPAYGAAYPYLYDGRRFCWYDDAWNGPGWYWCGYAYRRGFGWGGGYGWRGWVYRGGRGGHGGYGHGGYGHGGYGGGEHHHY
jgi:hypothetical protein